MRYSDGTLINRGDRVRLFDMQVGVVVFSVDTDEYSDEFPKDEWGYLKSGVMVKTENGALVHFANPDANDPNEITRIP